MRDADGTIERLLAGLREAEPSAGMQRRILEALDEVAAGQATRYRSLWRQPISPWLLRPAMALVSAVALLVAVAIYRHRHTLPDFRDHAINVNVQQETRPKAVVQKAPVARRNTTSRVRAKRPHDVPELADTQAASFPAPPLPLTEQERLLLRLAHRGDADNMAILNSDVRAALTARATEQFQQFFSIDATEMRSQSE